MSELQINSLATVASFTASKEGPNNDKVLAIHVKLRAPVQSIVLTHILGTDSAAEIDDAFWRMDRESVYLPRFVNVESIAIPNDTIFYGCSAKFGKWKTGGCRVHKFSFTPTEGRISYLTFTVSIAHPEPGLLPYIAELLGENIPVEVYEDQQELPLEQGETETESA